MSRQRSFMGTWLLLRFMLRRDRIQLPIWMISILIPTVATLVLFEELYPTVASLQETAAVMGSPASIAMTGPKLYLVDYHYGAMMGHQMLGFIAIVVALMSILLIVRHTRREEETGRTELIRAAVVGRHANTTASLLLAIGANVLLGFVLAVLMASLGIESVTWQGSWLYGAALASVGLTFTGITIVIVQFMAHARGAIGVSTGLLAMTYCFRAIGDVSENVLSWFSPIGWALQTAVYIDNRWTPLLISVSFTVVLIAFTYPLSTKRDVGAGMIAPRRGKAEASNSLVTPFGLVVRLQRTAMIVWGIALFLFGAMYGSFLGEAETILDSMGDAMEGMLPELDDGSFVDSVAAMFISVSAIITTIPVLQSILRLRAEEKEGRLDGILTGAVSRYHLLGSYLITSIGYSLILLLMVGLGMGLTGSQSMNDTRYLIDLVVAGLAYAPALWVVIGIGAALIGLFPKRASYSWAMLIFAFVAVYLGGVLRIPQWLMNVSPYEHIAHYPAQSLDWLALLLLTGVAAAFMAIGLSTYRRRDLTS